MIIAAITPIAFWVNCPKQCSLKGNFQRGTFRYFFPYKHPFLFSYFGNILYIYIYMYTFPRKWHSQKKKKEKKIIHNLDHSQPQPSFDSQSNLNFSPKFSYTSLLFLSHTNHTQVFRNFTAKVRSQIVKPWPQLHLAHREWLENANSFPFKTTRGEGGTMRFLFQGIVGSFYIRVS